MFIQALQVIDVVFFATGWYNKKVNVKQRDKTIRQDNRNDVFVILKIFINAVHGTGITYFEK